MPAWPLDPAVAEVRRAVRRALREHTGDGDPLTVACSGGADSLALAAAVAFEAGKAARPAGAVTVDHGLQDGSSERALVVAERLRGLGLEPVTVATVVVAEERAGGPEARARTVRYDALREVGGWVLLGHTMDDQAESVLLGLGRGSGPRSLAGMSTANPPWLRPLLGVRRVVTQAACAAEGLDVWDDPHNSDPAFTRVRLRHEVLPLLEKVLRGGVIPALARTADLLREDCAALDVIAAAEADRLLGAGRPEVVALAALPTAVRRRVLRLWLTPAGPVGSVHLYAVDALVTDWHGQGETVLPGGWAASRASGRLHLQPARGGTGGTPRRAP